MSLTCTPTTFTNTNVCTTPETTGVYELIKDGTTIYFGCATGDGVTIRTRLQAHWNGTDGSITKGATHFKFETCNNPTVKEAELMATFKKTYGNYPVGNQTTN